MSATLPAAITAGSPSGLRLSWTAVVMVITSVAIALALAISLPLVFRGTTTVRVPGPAVFHTSGSSVSAPQCVVGRPC